MFSISYVTSMGLGRMVTVLPFTIREGDGEDRSVPIEIYYCIFAFEENERLVLICEEFYRLELWSVLH